MENKSSKSLMEDPLHLLENIKEAEAPSGMYSAILDKIQRRKNDFVSPKWVLLAAAAIVVLLSFNVKLIKNTKDSSRSDFDVLFMMKPSNTFSYE
ncbi:hypothetical protein [uncultured Chryseobacterium sp.]|uniref:hypothetical protein n=1 Tax=uncultured Chryseobacterium sp. TaxID=259322 RepID=UPI0025D8FC13|nr:hypothetical protein [uncultured Chryseobacterium sp.]